MKSKAGETANKPSFSFMVVDDSEFACRTMEKMMVAIGGKLAGFAYNGREAIERYPKLCPDLVLMDITMPEKSGVGVYRKLREDEQYQGIPVLIITGVSDDFKQFISTRRQVPPPNGYLSKPVEPDQPESSAETAP